MNIFILNLMTYNNSNNNNTITNNTNNIIILNLNNHIEPYIKPYNHIEPYDIFDERASAWPLRENLGAAEVYIYIYIHI